MFYPFRQLCLLWVRGHHRARLWLFTITSVLLTGCAGLYLLVLLIVAGTAGSYFRNARTYVWCLCKISVAIGAALIWKVSWTSERSAALIFTFVPGQTTLLSLVGANKDSYTKRFFIMGLVWSVYCISNGVAPLFVKTTENAGQYPSFFTGVIASASISIACSLLMRIYQMFANKKRDQDLTAAAEVNAVGRDLTD